MQKKSISSLLCKTLLAGFIFCIVSLPLSAQTITNYSFTSSGGTFTTLSGATAPGLTSGSVDDGIINALPIGFDFWYMGSRYTTVSASTNGWLTLGSTITDALYTNDIAMGGTPRPVIAPLWDDLSFALASNISYNTTGTTGSRVFTVQFLNARWDYSNTANCISFQAKFYEGTGKIEFVYRTSLETGTLISPSASIGITAAGTGAGNFRSLNNAGTLPTVSSVTATNTIAAKPANNQAYSFTPPVPAAPGSLSFSAVTGSSMTLNWTDASSNETGFAIYSSTDGTNYTYRSTAAAGATTSAQSGLTPGTTYYWNVYAVSEGGLSTVLSGSQATTSESTFPYTFAASSGTFTALSSPVNPSISGGTVDDGYFNGLPIGFDFWYMGTRYTTLSASTNGWLTLGANITDADYINNLNNGTGLRPVIAPLWDDLDVQAATNVSYKVTGSAPNRVFTLQYLNAQWQYNATGNTISFQVNLHESTGKIEYVYRPETGTALSPSASIGITAAATGSGNFLSVNNAGTSVSSGTEASVTTKPASGKTYAFTPPVPTAPGSLIFSAVDATAMTLNWADLSSNERGFVIYRSSDGGATYNFVSQEAADVTSSIQSGLSGATTYYWRVYAVSEGGLSTALSGNQATSCSAPPMSQIPLTNLILHYKLDGNATDATGNNNGILQNAPTQSADRFGNDNKAYTLNGTSQYVSTANSYTNPGNYSMSIWFKTATSSGGLLMGFGSSRTGLSGMYDRNLYMSNTGQIYFGTNPSGFNAITVNSSSSYNDNNWHLATATLSSTAGMILYIDGVQVAVNAGVTSSQNYTGYWRIGYDNVQWWPSAPTSNYFNGTVDDAMIYHTALSSSDVSILYNSANGASNNGPVCTNSQITLSATSIPGASYSWTGPNGFSSSSQNPSFTFTTAAVGTYAVQVTVAGCASSANAYTNVVSGPVGPTLLASTTQTCIGGSTGSITASATGGAVPYTYSLNAGAYQSSTLFSGLAAGSYTLNVKSNDGCITSIPVSVAAFSTAPDNQTLAGTDSWIGHVYDGINFDNYAGHYTKTETFNENFGGTTTCLSLNSSAGARSIYTETFSVKYRMNSTKRGLYIADLGSDDGSRLTVDNTLIYNNWANQGFTSKPRALMSLTGSSSLMYEYYENTGGNQVAFENFTLVLANILNANTSQTICAGGAGGVEISGDNYGVLPAGISLSGTGFQWSYSTTPTGTRTEIAGATAAVFTPSALAAPFNTAGTYYVFRKAILTSTNNISPNPLTATNESNAAIITITNPPSANINYTGSPYCSNQETAIITRTGTAGGVYSSTPGLSLDASTGAINVTTSSAGTYTVTYTIAASGGCAENISTTSITITAAPSATISYPASPYYTNGGIASVNRTGTAGGAYSSTAGLTINAGTGEVDLATSDAGTYTVTYSLAASGGCAAFVTTTSITLVSWKTWDGGAGTANWGDANNWNPNGVPVIADNIDLSGADSISISIDAVANNILLNNPGLGLTISSGSLSVNDLTITAGILNAGAQTLKIAGTVSNNGMLTVSNAVVEFNGSIAQTIPAEIFSGDALKGLTVNNAAGVTLDGPLSITDALTVSAGSLTTNDHLTLKSSATATARVARITSISSTPVTGDVTVERYVPGRRKYRLITSSVTTSTATSLSPGQENLSIWGNWQNAGVNTTPNAGNFITGGASADGFDTQTPNASLFTYDDVNRKYIGYTSANGKNTKYTPLKAGVAFYMFVYGDRRNTITTSNPNSTVLSAKGTLKTGDQLYNTGSAIPLTGVIGRYTLLGNPFAAPINWATVPKTDIADTYWGWDPNLSSTGGYVTISTVGGVTITSPLSGSTGLNQYIQSGQGFFVKTSGASPSMTIREQDKVSNFNPIAFRGQGDPLPLLAINLQYTSGVSKVLADGVVAAFDNEFSNNITAVDASKMVNTAEGLAIANTGELLSIDARKMPVPGDTIFLNISKLTKPQYTLQLFAKELEGNIVQPFLEDRYLNTFQPVSLNDTTLVDFTVSPLDPASSDLNRFRIVFQSSVILPVKFISVKASQQDKQVSVKWEIAEETGISKYEIERSADGINFDSVGQLRSKGTNDSETYEWLDVTPMANNNYYRIRAIETSGNTILSKTALVNLPANGPEIRVFPNPVKNKQINVHINARQKGQYSLTLSDPAGRQLIKQEIDHPGGLLHRVIDVNKVTGGLYYLEIINKNNKHVQSVMIE